MIFHMLVPILYLVTIQLQRNLSEVRLHENVTYKTNLELHNAINKLYETFKMNHNESSDSIINRKKTDTFKEMRAHNLKNYSEIKAKSKTRDNTTINLLLDLAYFVHENLKIKYKFDESDDVVKLLNDKRTNNESLNTYDSIFYRNKRRSAFVYKYPFIVSVHIRDKYACTGSIINRHLALTTASCFYYNVKTYDRRFISPDYAYVRYASDHASDQGILNPVDQWYIHPSYDNDTLKHNLALVQVKEEFNLTRFDVGMIYYERNAEYSLKDSDVIEVIGWGAIPTDEDEILKHNEGPLVSASLYINNIEDCATNYTMYYVTDLNYCGNFVKTPGNCHGDVGSPGIYNNTLVGVVSLGAPICGDKQTVLTRIGWYTNWIEFIVNAVDNGMFNIWDPWSYPFVEKIQHITVPETNVDNVTNESDIFTDNILRERQIKQKSYIPINDVLKDVLRLLTNAQSENVNDFIYGDYKDDFKETFASTAALTDQDKEIQLYHSIFDGRDKTPRVADDYDSNKFTNTLPTLLPGVYAPIEAISTSTVHYDQVTMNDKHYFDLTVPNYKEDSGSRSHGIHRKDVNDRKVFVRSLKYPERRSMDTSKQKVPMKDDPSGFTPMYFGFY